ncbi:tetratricopeptide repeat protein [Streptomyces sp. NPDC047841]|uniref:tetratricopeptide repeat protein n=1 Tax=Streptomyces sp. NPDC047841 TaxID=3154708 RepID=UPI003453801F
MAGLSFEKKRAPQPVGRPAAVSVRVSGAGGASVDGAQVVAAPGQEIQQAVLDHLQRLAISVGAPIRATVHDDLAGCVVPLEVSADGSSRVTGEAVRVGPRPTGSGTPGAARNPTGQVGPAPVAEGPGTDSRERAAHSLLADVPPEPPAPTPTPARGFDAVAEEVLGDGPLTETAEGAKLLTGPMGRINEAVRAGRIDTAAELADRTLAEATAVFGPHHAEVLHLLELSAYIAYLAGDPVRAFRLSLDVARLRRQARDGEAAYDNVRSAATAWRAVRDPEEGLRLGRDLIDLWTDLTAEPGPAAGDPGPLESARARMVRLTARAAEAAARA